MEDEPAVTFSPWEESTTVDAGTTLLEAADDLGVGIESLCGGQGLCGTCKVVVDDGIECLSEPSQADRTVLSESQLADGYRLSCRAAVEGCGGVEDGCRVETTVPSASRKTGGIVLTEGEALEFDLQPAVRNYHVVLDPPALDDHVADRERLLAGLADAYGLDATAVDRLVQQELPNLLRAGETDDGDGLEVTATVYDGREVVDVRPGLAEETFGLAIDVGTTTLAVYLVDLRTGETEAVASRLNPQSRHGGDIMSRMRYARRHDDGREELQTAIIEGVNVCIEEVTTETGVDSDAIYEGVFVGNTAMHHLFCGIDPTHVAGSPYVPATHAPLAIEARELGVDVNPSGYLYWLPISGGWVGPDKVGVLLVSGHYRADEMTVCIDVGTNGEISVGNREQTWTTSAPAGPALEGAEITYGVRAQAGAIEAVAIDIDTLEPTIETIGDGPPNGICGSGVIDALAAMFVAGVVDRRGKFREAALDHPRVRRNEDGEWEYVLVRDADSDVDGDLVLTQNDLREIQMAKAAIQAGTRVLLAELGVEGIDRVVLAGGFGNYVDPESAMTVGLFPDVGFEKVESLGNAAGVGAKLALLDAEARAEAERIVDEVEYYEIAGTDEFRDEFMASMYLPHRRFEAYPGVKARVEAIREVDDVPTPDR